MGNLALSILVRFLVFVTYLAVGMVIFKEVEGDENLMKDYKKKQNELRINMTAKFNMTDAEFMKFAKQAAEAFGGPPSQWDYHNSFAFVLQTVTTVGYGTITPVTDGGRVLCIFYALFGIPLAGLVLQVLGKAQYNTHAALVKAIETRCLSRVHVVHVPEKCIALAFVFYATFILVSGGVYHGNGEGSFLEGVYAWFITYTTIGYGDIVPGQGKGDPAFIWLRLILMCVGLSAAATVISAIAEYLEENNNNDTECCGCLGRKRKQNYDVNGTSAVELSNQSG